jgi:hypothetical protein
MKTRALVLLFVALAALSAAACGSSPTTATTLTSIAVTGPVPTVGTTSQYKAVAGYSDGTSVDITSTATWSTSNAAVAVVSPSGLVTALTSGVTTITAAYAGSSGIASITVP